MISFSQILNKKWTSWKVEFTQNMIQQHTHNVCENKYDHDKLTIISNKKNRKNRILINYRSVHLLRLPFEPLHDKINKMTCAPSKDSDQPGHPPSLIRVFAVRMKKHWALNYRLSASEDSDQTGRMLRLIWIFAGRTSFCRFCRAAAHLIFKPFYVIIKYCLGESWTASFFNIWAAAQQNQQNILCTQRRLQSGHPPSLIRVFYV